MTHHAYLLISVLMTLSAASAQGQGATELFPLPPNATWHTLYNLYRHPNSAFVDDGATAEALSDFVVHRLATRWSTIRSLATLVVKDSAFGAFIVKHVDATTEVSELHRIVRYASSSCPLSARALCLALRTAAGNAVAQAAQPN